METVIWLCQKCGREYAEYVNGCPAFHPNECGGKVVAVTVPPDTGERCVCFLNGVVDCPVHPWR